MTALVIFAKAPIPGQVKTRLIPALGIPRATQLYRRMLLHTVATGCRAQFSRVEVCCTPDERHSEFQKLSKNFPVTLCVQQGNNLGQRMHHAMMSALERHSKVILIGSDCPQLRVTDLLAAQACLTPKCPLVLGPAKDGGYVLIGASKLDSTIFTGIPWGTDSVLELTRLHISQLGWQWRELRIFQDVDRAEDLASVPQWLLPDPVDSTIHLNDGVEA